MWALITGYWTYIRLGLIALAFAAVVTFVWSVVGTYTAVIRENEQLKIQIVKYDGRLASSKRMIDRRDAAIEQSKCKAQIQRWVRNPEEIPNQDTQFRHPLDINTTGQPNAVDSDPVAPFEWPDFSKVLPWNW